MFGVEENDPDDTYELTYDNCLKMLSTQCRFRANIPVVMMGETGSGKTRLVKFMTALQRGRADVDNMLILKIHGGTSSDDINRTVQKAISAARRNSAVGVKPTVVFFDEANTTQAIGTIKTVMCDRHVEGVPIPDDIGLQFVAAVNPYREHSAAMIRKLEQAGLGYSVHAEKTKDRIGKVPLRRLVYRVKEIPASMFPLIWDFGTLDSDTEKKYVSQMVSRLGEVSRNFAPLLLSVLCECQEFMRRQSDECSFVSLRQDDSRVTTASSDP